MCTQLLGLDRLKCARANVQRHACARNAQRVQPCQHSLIEMQRRSGCGHRTGVAGKNGLVAALVIGIVCMGDIRRQRHVAVLRHQRVRIGAELQPEQRSAGVRPAPQHRGGEPTIHVQHSTCNRFSAGFHMCGHGVCRFRFVQHAFDQQLHLAATGLATK